MPTRTAVILRLAATGEVWDEVDDALHCVWVQLELPDIVTASSAAIRPFRTRACVGMEGGTRRGGGTPTPRR
jgi:hypothetical protein